MLFVGCGLVIIKSGWAQVPYLLSMSNAKVTRDDVLAVRGAFTRRGGHTDEDVNSDLKPLSAWTGLFLVCLWDFDDIWGIGGNSEYAVVVPGKKGLYEAPSEISEFTFLEEGDPVIEPEKLLGLKPGAWIRGSNSYHEMGGHNWVRRIVYGEAD